jgi:P27 family predicted phage terminase small subunit
MFTTTNGYAVPSPAVAISQKAAQIMKSFLTEFGLTPASRSRVHLPEPKRDEVADFLERVSAEYDDLEPPSGDKSA